MTAPGVFAVGGFRRLFAAQTLSRWGDTFHQVALVILVFELTGSGLRVAGTVAFEVVPVLLLAPFAGSVADRLSKTRVMVFADLGRALLLLTLVLGPHHLALVYVVAFGLAVGSVFFNPSSSALLPTLVNEDQLVAANSSLWSAAVTSQILLAPVAGLLVSGVGPRPAFAINALSFVLSAAFLRRLPPGEATPTQDKWRRSVLQGFALARRNPLVRLLIVVQALAALSAGATSAMLVVLAQDELGLGPSGFGLLLSAIGIGAAAGPLLLRFRERREVSVGWLFGPYALRGAADLVLASTREPAIAGAALGLYGVGTSTGMVTFQTVMQTKIESAMRGRAFSLLDVTWHTARLASLVAGGLLADAIGIRAVYLFGGALLLLAAAVGFFGSRTLRRD